MSLEAVQTVFTLEQTEKEPAGQYRFTSIESAAHSLDLVGISTDLIALAHEEEASLVELFNEAEIALNILDFYTNSALAIEAETRVQWSRYRNVYRVYNNAGIILERQIYFNIIGEPMIKEFTLDNFVLNKSLGYDVEITYSPRDPASKSAEEEIRISIVKDQQSLHQLKITRSNYPSNSAEDTGKFHYSVSKL